VCMIKALIGTKAMNPVEIKSPRKPGNPFRRVTSTPRFWTGWMGKRILILLKLKKTK
jgi:hypothetical protein